MKNFGLKTRLILAVGFLAILMAVIAAIGYIGMRQDEKQLASAYDDQVIPVLELRVVYDSYALTIAGDVHRILDGSATWGEVRERVGAAKTGADAAWRSYAATNQSDLEKAAVADAVTALTAADRAVEQLRGILQKEDRERLQAFATSDLPRAIDALGPKLDRLIDIQRQEVQQKVAANESDEGSLKVELLVTTAVALVLAGVVAALISRLVRDLNSLVGQVRTAGVQVGTSVTEIAATAKEQQATANEIAATTSEIGATSKEISATSKELVKTMGDVAKGAEQTATLAGSGHAGLGRMEDMMRQVVDAAGAINGKLAVLNEKAGNINKVVTTITKVADQTNLLSLNAAIEAEKAGEYGRGFAVVATEIRRLADQTAVATYDIEQIVKEMLSAVSASVMGMDKFSEEVRRGVDEVRNVGAQLSQIIEQVQGLTPRFETVNEGMQAQATGAQQISEALAQLSEAAQQTVDSLRQSNLAIEQLNETAGALRTSVERIKT